MPDRNALVHVRNGIYNLLVGAIKKGVDSDANYVSAVLSMIDNMDDYSVNASPERAVQINGVLYSREDGDAYVLIYEHDVIMFTIYQDRTDKTLKVHCIEYHLKTDKQLLLEEAEEERRLELENEERNENRHRTENGSNSTSFKPFRFY